MKSFWISMILLTAMLVGIGINYAYINKTADELCDMLDALPDVRDPSCAEAAAELRDHWEEIVGVVNLSVGYNIVDRVSEQAATLAACAACGDFYGYHTALALLRDAVGDMRRLEGFSIKNLL